MNDEKPKTPWFREWFQPAGYIEHLAADLREAKAIHDRIRGKGQPIEIRPKPPRPGDPPMVIGDPFRAAYPMKANAARRGGRTMAPMTLHPFILDLEVSAAGDVWYCGRELRPRPSRWPVKDARPDRSHPWLIRIENPSLRLSPASVDEELPTVNLHMATVPLAVLVEETYGGMNAPAPDLRAAAWAALVQHCGVPSTDYPHR